MVQWMDRLVVGWLNQYQYYEIAECYNILIWIDFYTLALRYLNNSYIIKLVNICLKLNTYSTMNWAYIQVKRLL